MQGTPLLSLLLWLVACNRAVNGGSLILKLPYLKQAPPALSTSSPGDHQQQLQFPFGALSRVFKPHPNNGALPNIQLLRTTSPGTQLAESPTAAGAFHNALALINPFDKSKQPPISGTMKGVSPQITTSTPSTATASGLAFNGGKASAHAKSIAKSASTAQAVSSAAAVANRASMSVARATADASGPGVTGTELANSAANAVSDKSSIAVANAGSRAAGFDAHHSETKITSSSAAVNNSISLVGGTAVALSALNGSAITTSSADGAAANKGIAATRADSISIGFQGSTAVGEAISTSQAHNSGLAASQSLMESFAIDDTTSTASSLAHATATAAGVSAIRDKAATLGFEGSTVRSTTSSQGDSGVLGLSVIDSVARAITANNQRVCAEALTKTYSDITTGSQVSLDTFLLALKQRADAQCVSSTKDFIAHAAAQQAAKGDDIGSHATVAESQLVLPSFERLRAGVEGEVSALLEAASDAVAHIQGS